jgi:hypothetical protein
LKPGDALRAIARELRAEDTVISEHVIDPAEEPVLGIEVAAGPRCREAPGEYACAIESIREGYLVHYGQTRVLSGVDSKLALLAGDHLYALGLERLAVLGDLHAIRELADLISRCAQVHADGAGDSEEADALWVATLSAVAGT